MGDDAPHDPTPLALKDEVAARVARLDVSFNEHGFDRFGVSRDTIASGMPLMGWLYRNYFRVSCHGIEHIPRHGRVILVGNHSGGYAIDAGMVLAACFFELEPPRLAHGMADRFINRLPFLSQLANRAGQITGLPQHARQLLADERVLLVFPEGARGTSKLFWNRYTLGAFGTGFMRLAKSMDAPVVPFAYLGGGEAVPTIANLPFLGKLFGVPYIPVTPYLLPLPLPVSSQLRFGPPMRFQGTGDESQHLIQAEVDTVKAVIGGLIAEGRQSRARGPRPLPGER